MKKGARKDPREVDNERRHEAGPQTAVTRGGRGDVTSDDAQEGMGVVAG
jgi:hypothetical protein